MSDEAARLAKRFEGRAAPTGSMSFGEIMAGVRDAVVDRIEEQTGIEPEYLWLDDAGIDWAVYCIDADYWQVPYSMDANGDVTLGDAFEVERQTIYTPVVETTAGTASAPEPEQRAFLVSDDDFDALIATASTRSKRHG